MLSHTKSLISVIVPCYNQATYLDDCLKSVASQSYPNWECIIVNDGSTDNTESIAIDWTKRDKRFCLLNKSNGGLSSARNVGIIQARGVYILPLDADDYISIDYLKLAVQILDTRPDVKLIYGNAVKFGEVNEKWLLPAYNYDLLLEGNIIYCSAIYRKKDYLTTSGYDEKMLDGYEDWEFWLQLLSPLDRVYFLKDIVFYYRIKSESMLKKIDDASAKRLRLYVFNKHSQLYGKWEDPILLKRHIRLINSMYRESLTYQLGRIILLPFQKFFNLFK